MSTPHDDRTPGLPSPTGHLPTEPDAAPDESGTMPAQGMPRVLAGDTPAASTPPGGNTTTAPPPATPGAELVVPGYEVRHRIARGGMGVVYAATDLTLGREVAIKTLLAASPGGDEVRQFEYEAKVTARLPHPGVPPVHELGTLADGRPFLAMKLIRGETLSALLKARPDPSHDLPRFVQVFEAVCQAVAFAHRQGVIHLDLKPLNVMVGAFGEVQVMDWGLAAGPGAVEGRGTPAFMAPEQARCEPLDARADVFALSGTLCQVLTGKPTYAGGDEYEKARAADLSDAFARLDTCGADPELVALARRCLSPDPADRPADAGEVAAAVKAYREGVEDRLRRAEQEKATAEARAVEQRRKRRWQLGLAAAGVLITALVAGGAWWRDRTITRNTQAIESLVGQCEAALESQNALLTKAAWKEIGERLKEGSADALALRIGRCRTDLALLTELDRIDDLRWSIAVLEQYPGGRQSDQFDDSGDEAAAAGTRNARWSAAVRTLKGNKVYTGEVAAVFRELGIVPGSTPPDEVKRRLDQSLLRDRLISMLDYWAAWTRSAEVRALLTAADPDPYREEVRDALIARDAGRLLELINRPSALVQPPRFTVALGESKFLPVAPRYRLLLAAHHRRPGDFTLLMTLGNLHPANEKPTAAERVKWFQAAVAVRPDNSVAWNNLGVALQDGGDYDRSEAVLRESIRLNDSDPTSHNNLGIVLTTKKEFPAAVTAFEAAIRIDPDDPDYRTNLAITLVQQGDTDRALAEYRAVIKANPGHAEAHNGIGRILFGNGNPAGAVAAFREAVRLAPGTSSYHNDLGRALKEVGSRSAALAELREALRLDPNNATAHQNLGILHAEDGDSEAAEHAFRAAVRLAPSDPMHHFNLGMLLINGKMDLDGGIRCYREALRLDPAKSDARLNLVAAYLKQKQWHEAEHIAREGLKFHPREAGLLGNLGIALRNQGRLDEAEVAYRGAIQADPKLAGPHYGLGLVLRAKGEPEGAEAAHREAARLDPKNYSRLLRDLPYPYTAPMPREVVR